MMTIRSTLVAPVRAVRCWPDKPSMNRGSKMVVGRRWKVRGLIKRPSVYRSSLSQIRAAPPAARPASTGSVPGHSAQPSSLPRRGGRGGRAGGRAARAGSEEAVETARRRDRRQRRDHFASSAANCKRFLRRSAAQSRCILTDPSSSPATDAVGAFVGEPPPTGPGSCDSCSSCRVASATSADGERESGPRRR